MALATRSATVPLLILAVLLLVLVVARVPVVLAQDVGAATPTPQAGNQAGRESPDTTAVQDIVRLDVVRAELAKTAQAAEAAKQTADHEWRKMRLMWGFWSLFFTTGGLLTGIGILFQTWRQQHPKGSYGQFFAEGQFVQLVVIIVIAGNVCSMGIMGILEKGEISTIYAGIVGYILGKKSFGDSGGPPPPTGSPKPGGSPQPENPLQPEETTVTDESTEPKELPKKID